ncbi:MAG: ATP-NAD kinase family protein [Methanomassiliicoccales archaeon]|nr:ATP-NAD kinase family protein [Methanomassiliicoccales archaeon]
MRIGIIVNPIAGMGGSVGLKGTDGKETLDEAIRRGAVRTAEDRMATALMAAGVLSTVELMTCGGEMGASVLDRLGLKCEVVYRPGKETTAEDTIAGAQRLLENHAEMLVFSGGDGTARDILQSVDESIPVIGVPSGVKMHSAVFGNSPKEAGVLLADFIQGKADVKEAEVMDIDEDAFRRGRLSAQLKGYLLVPYDRSLLQPMKGDVEGPTADEEKAEVAEYFAENVENGVVYILGPGTTIAAIASRLGVPKTLLGVDAILDGRPLGTDLGERGLLGILALHPNARIVVTPIGSQGFILGRGNQQISPAVVRLVGSENVLVVSSPSKLATIENLKVDTGDVGLDKELQGYRRVLVGRGRWKMLKVS